MEVSPLTPISRRASFTSSSRCGLMTARISFIRSSQARTPRQEVLLRRRRLLLPRGGLLRSRLLLRVLDRLLQRLHQIDHLGRLGLRDDLDLLARDLLLDDPEQRLPIFVLELRRAELVGEVVDEALGHLHFLRPDIDILVEDLELGYPDLVRPEHRLQYEDGVFEAQRAEVLLLPQGDLGHRHPAVLLHGLSEQRVRLHPRLFGDHVVGPLEVERIDLLQVDELHDVDGPAGLYGNRGEVLVLEHDVLVLLVLVSLHDVLEGNFLAIGGAHPLVLDAPVVLVVELVEAKRLLLRRWEQADRDGDQAEGDRSFPHGSRHDTPPGKKQPPVGGALIVLPPSYPSGSSARLDSSPRYDGNMAGKRGSGPAFTVEFPTPLLAEKKGEHWWMVVDGQELRLSNLDKVFWPDEGYTKGDLVAYYFNVAPLIIPYLAGRPLTMKRMPNGITGQFFYEKEAPSHTPDWMPRCAVESAGTGDGRWGPPKHEVINYLMVEHAVGLLFMANLGCIEFHPLHSRCGSIESPDYLFFDLDPFPPAVFEDVLAVASLVRVACKRLGLTAYPKTSGATRAWGHRLDAAHVEGGGDGSRSASGFHHRLGVEAVEEDRSVPWRAREAAGHLRGARRHGCSARRPDAPHRVASPRTGREEEGLTDALARPRREPIEEPVEERGSRHSLQGSPARPVRQDARLRGHPRTRRRSSLAGRQHLRHPASRRYQAPLRPAAGARGRPGVVGRSQGLATREGRAAPGGPDRGPSDGIRILRRDHPEGALRRGGGSDLGPGNLRPPGVDGQEGQLPPARGAIPWRIPPREDQGPGLADPHGQGVRGAAPRAATPLHPDAGAGRLRALRRDGVVVRAEVRRSPDASLHRG